MSDTNTGIVVVGTGEVRRTPTAALVRIGVNTTRATVRDASAEAAERARAVIAALEANGVRHDDITTARLALAPQYEHDPGGRARRAGYSFSNVVTALVRDVDRTGEVIDAAVEAGGDDAVVEGVTFTDQPDDSRDDATGEAEARARAAAFVDARAKAEQLAALAGVALGAPTEIQEVGRLPAPRELGEVRMMAARDAGTPIAPGQLTTSVTLTVRFAIL